MKHPLGRRDFIGGLVASGLSLGLMDKLLAMSKLPPGQSIYSLRGKVYVDGVMATIHTPITAMSTIRTGPSSEIVFAVDGDAFTVRENSQLKLKGKTSKTVELLRVLTGAVLAVYARGPKKLIHTSTATIGIRGTATYIESEPNRSYICTCYGEAILTGLADGSVSETVRTRHHESPRYIENLPGGGSRIVEAPVINHTDAELSLLESLVGRIPPFEEDDSYGAY